MIDADRIDPGSISISTLDPIGCADCSAIDRYDALVAASSGILQSCDVCVACNALSVVLQGIAADCGTQLAHHGLRPGTVGNRLITQL
jgi:hypothetical protein